MIIKFVPLSEKGSFVDLLPHHNMIVDPRPILPLGTVKAAKEEEESLEWKFTVEDKVLRVTRLHKSSQSLSGWNFSFHLRIYKNRHERFSFKSTKYLFQGVDEERSPIDATEVIVKEGVEAINGGAFFQCTLLERITIPNSVKKIYWNAFYGCTSLRYVKLPPNLQNIGVCAFENCKFLEAVHIPRTVKAIGDLAFLNCSSLKIVNFPAGATKLGGDAIEGCREMLSDEMKGTTKKDKIHWLKNRYNAFHNLCWDPSVTSQAIKEFILTNNKNEEMAKTNDRTRMTALHILAANLSVNGDMITAYLQLAPEIATVQDSAGKTPLHILCSNLAPLYNLQETSDDAIRAYLMTTEGKHAALMKDNEGKTPFQYLCLSYKYDEMKFLKEKNFGSLMLCWYDWLGAYLFADDFPRDYLEQGS